MASRANNNMQGSWPKWEARLQQPLPKAGERAADRERATAAVAMAVADYEVMASEMAADTAMAMAEADAATARAALLDEQVARINRVLASVEARIAAGQGRAADRLALQSRAASMRLMAEKERRMAADAADSIRSLLGLGPEQALPAFAVPLFARIAPASVPAARLAAAKAAEAAAMAKMAKASANPMTAIGFQASREEMPLDTEDMVGIAFMMEIPWHSRRYARADEMAAVADEAAARAEGTAAEQRAATAVARVERAGRVAETARRLAGETRARLDAEYEALVRSTSAASGMAGESAVLMILEILEKQADAQLQVIDAEAAMRSAQAGLWKYSGPGTFPNP